MKVDWRVLALIVPIAFASGFVDYRIRQFPEHAYLIYIPTVVAGTAEAPGKYRVLAPFLNSWMGRITGLEPAAVWHATRLAWFLVAFLGIYVYLQHWFCSNAALAGVAAVGATLPLTHTNSWAHADSIPELALFTLGCLAIVKRRDLWFAGVLVLAALNRETAVFLVGAYVLRERPQLRHLTASLLFSVICIAILLGLRTWRGFEHYEYWQLWRNLVFLKLLPAGYDLYKRLYAWFIVFLAGPVLAILVTGWSSVPGDARRLALSAVPLVGTGLLISSIIEPRIFLPLYPLLLPALMCVLVQPKRGIEE